MRHTYYFLLWILSKMFRNRPKVSKKLELWWEDRVHSIRAHPGVSFWLCLVTGLCATVVSILIISVALLLIGKPTIENTLIVDATIFGPLIICLLLYVILGITALHRAYMAEQERVIQILKD